jgi:hypothetical protein
VEERICQKSEREVGDDKNTEAARGKEWQEPERATAGQRISSSYPLLDEAGTGSSSGLTIGTATGTNAATILRAFEAPTDADFSNAIRDHFTIYKADQHLSTCKNQ